MIALMLITSYSAFLISAIIRGQKSPCSCYGPWMKITATQGLILNLVYGLIIIWILSGPVSDMIWLKVGPAVGLTVGFFRLKSVSSQRA